MRSYATTTWHSGAAGSWREGENDGARRKVEKGGEIRNACVSTRGKNFLGIVVFLCGVDVFYRQLPKRIASALAFLREVGGMCRRVRLVSRCDLC